MTRQKILLAFSMLSRLGTGFVSLFVLARGLGPADYGFVATVFAYSSIAALITDFGFSVQALRDIGAEPARAGSIMAACIRVKNILVAATSLVALGVLFWLRLDPHLLLASLLLYASLMAMSYGDLALVALRGIGRYDLETHVVVAGTMLFLLLLGGTAFLAPDILPIAAAMFGARLGQAAISFVVVQQRVLLGNCLFGPLSEALTFVRNSSALALDSALTTLSGQLDTIFVSATLGLDAAGLYQVAARIAGYIQLPIQVFAGVYIPALSSMHHRGDRGARRLERRIGLEFSVTGIVLALVVAFAMPVFGPLMFGAAFVIPAPVWQAFGILVALRFVAAALGVALTASRGVRFRLLGQGVSVLVLIVTLPPFLQGLGLLGAPAAMVLTTLVTISVYAWGRRRLINTSTGAR